MRKMKEKSTGKVYEVKEHIILKNFWEYYIIEKPDDNNVFTAIVMGNEIEIGDVSLDEIKPYILTRTKIIDMFPCQGFEWVE